MFPIKELLPAIRYAIATVLISIGVLILAWLFSRQVDFGEGVLGWIQKFFTLWLLIGSMSAGIVLLAYHEGVPAKKLAYLLLGCFGGIHLGLGVATTVVGVPFDSSYGFGINAVMFSTAIMVLLPSITIIIAIITIYITKSDDWWYSVVKVCFVAVLMIIYALFVIPNIMALV